MKKITKSDIITHKEFIDSLITRYSEHIDNYDFDDDFKINGYERNGDKLKIFASVLENNKTYSQIINADIDNEKIKNIKFNENKINLCEK